MSVARQGFIRLTTPAVGATELRSIKEVLDSGMLTEGETCALLERRFARYVGCRYAVATSSGTSALHLALLGLGIGPGDEVLVPDFTFPASANAVMMAGASPILVDIDSQSYNIDASGISDAITRKTRAIMAVHLFGLSADMQPILRVANEHGLKVIEDAACAIGTTYRGRRTGTLGDVACFSFHPRKILTTAEGGMITTNNRNVAKLVARVKNHGAVKIGGRSRFVSVGYNYRLSDVHAAIGLTQLKKISQLIRARVAIAKQYTELLRPVQGIIAPYSRRGDIHTFQSYVVRVTKDFGRNRDAIIGRLKNMGIETQIGTYALHVQEAFRSLPKGGTYPNSTTAYETTLSLPISSVMKPTEVERVVKCLRRLRE